MKAFPVVIYFTSKSEEQYVIKKTAEDEKVNSPRGEKGKARRKTKSI
jgi:hypothetical protein